MWRSRRSSRLATTAPPWRGWRRWWRPPRQSCQGTDRCWTARPLCGCSTRTSLTWTHWRRARSGHAYPTAASRPSSAGFTARTSQADPLCTPRGGARWICPALLDDGDGLAGGDGAALAHAQLLDRAGRGGGYLVLHLHRLDHAYQRALVDRSALLDRDLEHGALEWGDQLAGRAAATGPAPLAALRRLARRAGHGRRAVRAGRRADDLDVELPA